MHDRHAHRGGPLEREAGFTLVEALVAIIVLVFGLMAVTNLMLVAASSNSVANQSTAAVTSATRALDLIRSTSFMQGSPGSWSPNLVAGGETWDPSGTWTDCDDVALAFDDWGCQETVPGVGLIHTQWWISTTDDPRLLHVRVQSEGQGVLSGARSRAEFTTFRSCTNSDPASGGCPEP
jgi:Tfp pilus assembly protein PilW